MTEGAMYRLTLQYTRGRLARNELRPRSARNYQYTLSSFARSFGNRTPKTLSKADIERWLDSLTALSPNSRRIAFSTVRHFVRWLQSTRVIKHDPMIGITPPKTPRRVPRALSPDETDRLLAALPNINAKVVVALMLWGGLRRVEVTRLQRGDWDELGHTLFVLGKGDHEREVPVTDRLDSLLRQYVIEQHIHAGPLVLNYHGRPATPSWITKHTREWMESCGVKTAPHDGKACHSLRHTLASNVVDVEPDLRVTQQILGHANLTSTQIYLRRTTMIKARNAMERAA